MKALPGAIAVAFAVTAAHSALAVVISAPAQVGTLSTVTIPPSGTGTDQLREISGVVGSRSLPGVLWMHNDSGDVARFFAVNTSGAFLGQKSLASATATDWEDIAIGPSNFLYLADIGDNGLARSNISIFRTAEPTTSGTATIPTTAYTKVNFTYPDTAHNAESLIVDPINSELFIITKATTGRVYSAPLTAFNSPLVTTQLTFQGLLNNISLPFATAADISPDGKHILVRNGSTTGYLFERGVGQSVWNAMQGTPIPFTLANETQGETIGWAADGSGFYTTSEWGEAGARPIYFYAFSVPEPASLVHLFGGLIGLVLLIRRRVRN